MGLPRGEIGYLQSGATGPTRLSWAPGLVLLDCAEVAHTRAKIMWTQTHWEPEGVCAGAGEISSLTTSATASLFLRQMRTLRFRGLDLPKATALHVKATATQPCSSPRSPSESFVRSPAPQQLFLCRLGEAGPPDALPRAPEQ